MLKKVNLKKNYENVAKLNEFVNKRKAEGGFAYYFGSIDFNNNNSLDSKEMTVGGWYVRLDKDGDNELDQTEINKIPKIKNLETALGGKSVSLNMKLEGFAKVLEGWIKA